MISYQDKLNRIKRPRVHITYNVETEGSEKKIELPFILGIITNLSGDTNLENKRVPDFVNVDSSNLDSFLSKQQSTLTFTVPNVIINQGNIGVKLSLSSRTSFEIVNLVKQIPELNEVYYKIQAISKIATMSANNSSLANVITSVLLNKQAENLVNALKEKLSTLKTSK
jgi:type VI secretion system protein ImpB